MRSFIIKIFFGLLIVIATVFLEKEVDATCILCDGGRYRTAGMQSDCGSGTSGCTGYNNPCYSPNGSYCGGCFRCVNGSYVPSGQDCNQYSTPPCTKGANYPLCWAYYWGSEYLWWDQLSVPNNMLCCTPKTTTCTTSTCNCTTGKKILTCNNGCATTTTNIDCNPGECKPPDPPSINLCLPPATSYRVTLTWTDPTVTYIDLSTDSTFTNYSHKCVIPNSICEQMGFVSCNGSSCSTNAPDGFNPYLGMGVGTLISGNTYYARLFNGKGNSGVIQIREDICQ